MPPDRDLMRSGQMGPRFSPNDIADRWPWSFEHSGKFHLRNRSCRIQPSYLENHFWRKFGHSVIFSALQKFWMEPGTIASATCGRFRVRVSSIAESFGTSPVYRHMGRIVSMRSFEQVKRIAATAVCDISYWVSSITGMAYKQANGINTRSDAKCDPVRYKRTISKAELAITATSKVGDPKPALIRSSALINLRPESVDVILRERENWSNVNFRHFDLLLDHLLRAAEGAFNTLAARSILSPAGAK